MAQYIPDVSEADIQRILSRDFPAQTHAAIHEMIRGVEVREKTRVVLACFKNAVGSIEKLRGELTNAGGYWREIIGEAEYPNYTKKMFRIDKLSADEKAHIIEKDKSQYLKWFGATGANDKSNEA